MKTAAATQLMRPLIVGHVILTRIIYITILIFIIFRMTVTYACSMIYYVDKNTSKVLVANKEGY